MLKVWFSPSNDSKSNAARAEFFLEQIAGPRSFNLSQSTSLNSSIRFPSASAIYCVFPNELIARSLDFVGLHEADYVV
jgi:hypothetical protein